ncbi:MAG: hypothetical protein DI570_30815 [Phenylobacterium zucineum]|nr:MAG: hypothetical protein DI570_30815 [Phenylobacterium zucineum]
MLAGIAALREAAAIIEPFDHGLHLGTYSDALGFLELGGSRRGVDALQWVAADVVPVANALAVSIDQLERDVSYIVHPNPLLQPREQAQRVLSDVGRRANFWAGRALVHFDPEIIRTEFFDALRVLWSIPGFEPSEQARKVWSDAAEA